MVEQIPSGELFGNIGINRGPAPEHTKDGHELCAYYMDDDKMEMICPHGQPATGAFYSEDLVKQLKETAHFLINLHDLEQQKPLKIEALRKLTV